MSDVWLTPKPIIDALGPFDLDPCAAPEPRPWPTAAKHYVEADMGLMLPWEGFVWLNPPYSDIAPWMERIAAHDGGGIALTFTRTDTNWFFRSVWRACDALLFIKRRVRFCLPDGTETAGEKVPSVLIAYTPEAVRRLARADVEGHLVLNAPAIALRGPGRTWRAIIDDAMAGRPARLQDLYAAVGTTEKGLLAMRNGIKWREKVRRVLQEHFRPIARGVWAPA